MSPRPRAHEPASDKASSRLRRRARDLMSLASLAAFFAGGGWLIIAACLLLNRASHDSSATAHAHHLLGTLQWLPSPQADYRILAAAWLLGCTATLSPLIALRRLGRSLWRNPSLNHNVARRLQVLAHALLFSLLGDWSAGILASSQAGHYRIVFGMGTWSQLTAILLAYIVAELVRQGATAAAENREFV